MSELNVYRPFDGGLIRCIPMQTECDVDRAIATAHQFFSDRKTWMPPYQRIDILERTIAIMSSQIDSLARLASEEGGKPYMDSKVEVMRAINGVKLAIEYISHIKGEQIPMGQTLASMNRLAFTVREPIGVVSSISAFNHPLNLIVHQVIPAIAVGCPVIVKPSLTTPLSCLRFLEILAEAGLPSGWCQSIVCENDAASQLVSDPRINFLSFIGSANVGWMLRSKLAPGTRCALEHGGAAPVIVDGSANLDDVVQSLAKGAFYHAGQVCVSVQRVYVQQHLSREFAIKLAQAGANMKVGDPLDPLTEVGPLILPREVDRVDEWVKEAIDEGAELIGGGKRISESCYAPTVLLNPPEHVRVSQMEIFGPVVCVYSYTKKQEAVARANGLPFAFQASVFTNDLDDALNLTQQLNATAIMINDHTAFRVDWMPFGGRDASGIGLGGIQYSMHEMTRDKMIVFKSAYL